MLLFFVDDARQRQPSREGMGALVATSAFCVDANSAGALERAIDALCKTYRFPPGEEFKWSPHRDQWMHAHLVGEERHQFFVEILTLAAQHQVRILAVIEDTSYARAAGGRTPEIDVTRMLLERIENQLAQVRTEGIVIADRPGGGRPEEDKFLVGCLETLQSGTVYVKPARIAFNVVSTPSHLIRLLQLGDVVTSCTLARVSGEALYSPPVFAHINPLLYRDLGRAGGVGLKMHPDYVYRNLYHWLLGDTHLVRWPTGIPLPIAGRPYSTSPDKW